MTYDELLQELVKQPHITHGPVPKRARTIVGGMGGSSLPAHAVRFLDQTIPIAVHRDYDLPEGATDDALYVAISYSGNTAETLSFAQAVHSRGFPLAIVDSAGALLDFARENTVPHVEVPEHVQPRNALFFLTRALLAVLGRDDLAEALAAVSFDAASVEAEVQPLAQTLAGALPLFYASRTNGFLAYVSKIHCNETAKMPAYANVFPELNHNEMQSFDSSAPEAVGSLARFVLLHDSMDDERIARRMQVFAELMRERGRSVTDLTLTGATRAEKLVRMWYLGHLTARTLAEARQIDPDTVPMVEDFKKRL